MSKLCNRIPTCMFNNNMANMLSHMLTHLLNMEVLTQQNVKRSCPELHQHRLSLISHAKMVRTWKHDFITLKYHFPFVL